MKKFFTLTLALLASFSLWAAEESATGFCTLFNSYTSRAILKATPSGTTLVDNVYLANNGSVSNVKTDKAVKLSNGAVVFYLKEKAVVKFTFLGGSSNTSATIKGYDFIINNTTTTDALHSIPEVFRAYTFMSGTTNKSCADWLNLNGSTLCADGTTTFYTFFSTNIGMTTKSGAIKSESKVYNLFTSMTGDYASTCFTSNKKYDGSVTEVNDNQEKDFEVTLNSGYYAFNLTTSNTIGLKSVTFTSATPTLTGAWKISADTVTSANIVQGTSATLPTFSVGATSSTPTSSDYTVVYSLKEGSTSGIFTFTDGVPTGIVTTSAGSATLIATLTTTDDTKFLTPETNTFEYTVSVSEASAPTVTVTGAGSIARGGELTLTAEKAGVPSPSINWYACNSEGTLSGESLGTADTYAPSTTTVGTYYFRAVVNNGVGGDASHNVLSAVQTITVNPKAPTLPASANFVDSKSVIIEKDGDEDESAVIKYSTDGETYYTYSEAIVLSATTTIYAKVEQAGLSSAVASATYTLIVLDEQVDVTGSVTWDWSEVTNSSDVDFTDTDLRNVDILYSNISKYGFTAISGLASQQALIMNGQFPYRNANGSKHCQVNSLKFNTTVAGSVTIEYANTGKNAARTINVNGTKGSESVTTNTDYVDEVFNVAVGTVTIKGVQVSDDADKMLRIRKVVFTKSETVGVNNVETSAKAVKVLKNGVLFIEKNGKVYNAQGNVVK